MGDDLKAKALITKSYDGSYKLNENELEIDKLLRPKNNLCVSYYVALKIRVT